ncbi:MAG TPA: metallophosphoesterase, partial [Chitinophagaceae bacterium]
MRNSPFFLILIGTMILLDFYVFQGIKVIAQPAGSRAKSIIYITYWTLSILALLTFVLLPYINAESFPRSVRNVIFAIIVALFFSKLIVAIF